jgi:capsular exopolysaccharide synthesis family protein
MLKTLPQLQDAQSEEAKLLNSGLGENHMRVRSLRAQRDVYRATLAQQLDSIKRSQRTKLSIEEINLKTIEDKLSDLRAKQIKEKTLLTGYVEKKANYLSAKSLLMAIEQRYAAAKFDQVLSTIPVKIWEKAEPGLYPEKPKVPVYMLLAALIGIVVGVGLAFFIEYLDTSVKTIEDIEKYLSLTVLAVVPRDIAVLIKQKRDSADAEVYRILKANIEFNQADREANSYTLVSGGPGEGKSTTLNNLAYTYAKSGARVLVVDADLRRPSQHRFFDIDNSVGLADYIQHKAELEAIIKPTKLENLSFIPSGKLPQDDAGILNSPRMGSLISQLKKQYDIVFLDSPPILGVSDASMLVSEVDNTIMVVQHRRFPRGMLQRVKQTVAHVGGNLIGVVLNNVDTRQDDSYSYYSNYNDYYAPHKDQGAAEKKTKATANALNDEGEKY